MTSKQLLFSEVLKKSYFLFPISTSLGTEWLGKIVSFEKVGGLSKLQAEPWFVSVMVVVHGVAQPSRQVG